MPGGPSIDAGKVLHQLLAFIREQAAASGRSRLVVGLSGGLDSATSIYLADRALGSENIFVFILPYLTTSKENIEDALLVASGLGIEHDTIDITAIVDTYFEHYPEADRKRRGNFMARTRMAILYDQSELRDALVLGTGNRTESLLGYTTLWGDMACAFNPLGGLYKTQVRQFAEYLNVPASIIDKAPSADLWAGQTDEGELGITYEEVDRLLYHMLDLGYGDQKLQKEGFSQASIAKVRGMVQAASFKRCMPPFPTI